MNTHRSWESELWSLKSLSSSSRTISRSDPHADPNHAWLTILNNFKDPVALFDRQLRHVYVNEATSLATNIPSESFRGKRMRELGHPEEICREIDSNVAAVFETGEDRAIDLIFDGPDGKVHYESRMFPEFGGNNEVEFVIVISRVQRRL